MTRHLILYDGVCGLCNRLVRFVLPRDTRDRFRFAPLQSAAGREALKPFGASPESLDTFYVIENPGGPRSRLLDRDRGAIFVLERLGFPWALAWVFNVVPRFLRRPVYDFVARHRYGWFGRYDTCPVPPPEHRTKFL